MDRRNANIIFLLFAGLMCQELYHFVDHDNVKLVDWFIYPPKYLPDISWYVHDIGQSISLLLWFWAFYMACFRVRVLQKVLTVFMLFAICDLALFFICYKTSGYQYVYLITGISSYFFIAYKSLNK